MGLIIFLIIFFIYVEKSAWRYEDEEPISEEWLDLVNSGCPPYNPD